MTIARIIAGRDPASIISCDISTTVADSINTLALKRIGAMPVMRAGAVAGIVSERDVIHCLSDQGRECLDKPVESIMTSPVMTVAPSTKIDEALSMMTRRRFRHFPVIENDRLVAFISIGDLVKHKIDEIEHEAAAMRDYIQTG